MYNIKNWRGKFINSLIKDLNLKSYLELGISKGWCWEEIELENKVGVEINPEIPDPRIVKATTDDYFNSLDKSKKFDIIFIDADHEKNQVFKDFKNSYNALSDDGLILMHDVNPLTEFDIRPTGLGNCFAFWIDLVGTHKEATKLFIGLPNECEGSIGIYFKNKKKFNHSLITNMDYSYSYFDNNRLKYVEEVKSSYEDLLLFWNNQ